MHGGVVQNLLALGHAQKSRALLERLCTQLGHFEQLPARGERTVLFAVLDNVRRDARVKSRDPGKQGRGRGIQVDADRVDAVLDDAVQRLGEPLFGHVVLVLPHADGLGVDLDKFRERILQASCNGDGGAQVDVKIGEFRCRQGRRGIDRRARLIDDGVGDARILAKPADEFDGHLLGLAARRAVADGDMPDGVLSDERGELFDALALLALAVRRIDDGGIQHLARTVHNGDLAAHAIPGIQPHRHKSLDGRLH